jgi:hypothetical protein
MPRRRIKPRNIGRPGVPVKFEKIRIRNAPPDEFRQKVLQLPQLAYQVETLKDGRKILVTKPGGKSPDDIMVWVYEGPQGVHWRPSHNLIYKDMEKKIKFNKSEGLAILDALERVYQGEDPEDILAENPQLGQNLPGLPADLILKAYKWIWVQEDCNYPPPKYQGRKMSMDKMRKLRTI